MEATRLTAPRNARHDPRSARRHTIPHSALTDPFETHNLAAPSHSSGGTVGMAHSQRDGTPFHTRLSLTPLRLTTLPLPHTAPPVQYATYSVAVSGIVIPIATKPMPCTIVVPRRPKERPHPPPPPSVLFGPCAAMQSTPSRAGRAYRLGRGLRTCGRPAGCPYARVKHSGNEIARTLGRQHAVRESFLALVVRDRVPADGAAYAVLSVVV